MEYKIENVCPLASERLLTEKEIDRLEAVLATVNRDWERDPMTVAFLAALGYYDGPVAWHSWRETAREVTDLFRDIDPYTGDAEDEVFRTTVRDLADYAEHTLSLLIRAARDNDTTEEQEKKAESLYFKIQKHRSNWMRFK